MAALAVEGELLAAMALATAQGAYGVADLQALLAPPVPAHQGMTPLIPAADLQPSLLGKTMLAVCIATKHVHLGATARFITAQHLACAVLVLGEFGYLPTSPGFGPALCELIAGRHEHRPTLITSNKSLTDWGAIDQDASLAAALIDRILHHRDVFDLKGSSWRVKRR